jgi:AraC family transcriptional regulator of adaptative response / DNA-3-methyladenine glycosylase II
MLHFYRQRALEGVECVTDDAYFRTVKIANNVGWIRVRNSAENNRLIVDITQTLVPVLPELLSRIRRMFDIDASPDVIYDNIKDESVINIPKESLVGIRLPGSLDWFEVACRAVIGQVISVKAASTITTKFTQFYGIKIKTPIEKLYYLSPDPSRVAKARISKLQQLGLTKTKARTIIDLARFVVSKSGNNGAALSVEEIATQLKSIRGVGDWTANYILMRGFNWPDAFLEDDLIIRRELGDVSAAEAKRFSERWHPWRSYATIALWNQAGSTQHRPQ